MLGFLKRVTQKRLNYEQLQIVQMVVQQVVLSIEGSIQLNGPGKKAMALQILGQILTEMRISAPDSLVDALIESSVQVLNTVEKTRANQSPSKKAFDISGRPKTGGSYVAQ